MNIRYLTRWWEIRFSRGSDGKPFYSHSIDYFLPYVLENLYTKYPKINPKHKFLVLCRNQHIKFVWYTLYYDVFFQQWEIHFITSFPIWGYCWKLYTKSALSIAPPLSLNIFAVSHNYYLQWASLCGMTENYQLKKYFGELWHKVCIFQKHNFGPYCSCILH